MRHRRILAALAAVWLVASVLGAAGEGKPRLNVYFSKGFEDTAWKQAAFDRVAKSWSATTPPQLGKKAVVIATIGRDGKVVNVKIGTPSGSKPWDEAALAAVRKAAPFPPLPKSWTETSTEVHWHFAFEK